MAKKRFQDLTHDELHVTTDWIKENRLDLQDRTKFYIFGSLTNPWVHPPDIRFQSQQDYLDGVLPQMLRPKGKHTCRMYQLSAIRAILKYHDLEPIGFWIPCGSSVRFYHMTTNEELAEDDYSLAGSPIVRFTLDGDEDTTSAITE